MSRDARDQTLVWNPIPMDACHSCFDSGGTRREDPLYGLGFPVAVSGIESNRQWVSVRYICPTCRSVWDCSFDVQAGPLGDLGQFRDRYISGYEEGLRAMPMQDVPFPAGPAKLFNR